MYVSDERTAVKQKQQQQTQESRLRSSIKGTAATAAVTSSGNSPRPEQRGDKGLTIPLIASSSVALSELS